VLGAILVIIALVVVIPVSVLISGGILSGIIGYFVQKDVDAQHEGSELIDLNG
jgi:hypothetical protein